MSGAGWLPAGAARAVFGLAGRSMWFMSISAGAGRPGRAGGGAGRQEQSQDPGERRHPGVRCMIAWTLMARITQAASFLPLTVCSPNCVGMSAREDRDSVMTS